MKSYTTKKKTIPFAIDDTEFLAYPMPGSSLMEFVAEFSDHIAADGTMNLRVATGVLMEMFAKVMVAEEYARFRSYVDDPANTVDAELLSEIFTDIMAEATGRPTVPPSASPDGRQTTGTTSTADALLRALETQNAYRQPVS